MDFVCYEIRQPILIHYYFQCLNYFTTTKKYSERKIRFTELLAYRNVDQKLIEDKIIFLKLKKIKINHRNIFI
jgi:hypothetical protein